MNIFWRPLKLNQYLGMVLSVHEHCYKKYGTDLIFETIKKYSSRDTIPLSSLTVFHPT
jgi:hypothetical protein